MVIILELSDICIFSKVSILILILILRRRINIVLSYSPEFINTSHSKEWELIIFLLIINNLELHVAEKENLLVQIFIPINYKVSCYSYFYNSESAEI